jgi:PAB1-binding protein PBP1
LVHQISEGKLVVESRDGWHYVRQSCLPAKIVLWSRLFATSNNNPPLGTETKIVEDEKSEMKRIEKKSLDTVTEASPIEKKPVTEKEQPQVVIVEKKTLMTDAEQQNKKTNMLKEVVNKGTIISRRER